MELNAEQIKKVLEHCANWTAETGCKGCPYDGDCIDKDVMKDALTLINSLEQRIKELTEEKSELWEERNRIYNDLQDWKEIAEQYQKQFEDCAEDRAKLTEENERLRDKLERTDRALIVMDKAHNKLFTESFKIKADTVRKMQEKVKLAFVNRTYPEFYTGRSVHITIDQIAKEMLEGNSTGSETCVVCGDSIPEGRQVCPKCEVTL